MILIDDNGKKYKCVFGYSVTGRSAKEIIIELKELEKLNPDKTIDYIQSVLASRLLPGGKISIVLDSGLLKNQQ